MSLYSTLRYKAGYAAGTVEAQQPREHPSVDGSNPFALGYRDALYDASVRRAAVDESPEEP